jgi:hypothetical protein
MTRRFTDLSTLVSAGRAGKGVPGSRGEVLEALLRKRAAAWRGGLSDLESKLRNQILWSLPIEAPEEPPRSKAGATEDEVPPVAQKVTRRRKSAG